MSRIGIPGILALLLLLSCTPNEEKPFQPTPYELATPLGFPTNNSIPDDNPMTVEGVALGKLLFHDAHLLNDRPINCCASCHHEAYSYEYGPEATPEFLGTTHAMLPLINLAWNTTGLGWNGSVPTLEDMVYAAYTDPTEIDTDTCTLVARLNQSDTYPELFQKAFGTEKIHFGLVEKAIAQYVRSLVFCNSKFDRYLRGEAQLTQDELNGYRLFITEEGADCFHCHGGGSNALFTTHRCYNNGLDAHSADEYKAPTLRNIARTAPYMHDGRFSSLDEVIDFYSDSLQYSESISPLMHHVLEGGVHLTEQEKVQLKAFLNTLTDP